MTEPEVSVIPAEARSYQGRAAGMVTRLLASTLDAFVVMLTLAGAYVGYGVARLFLSPRTFQMPEASPLWSISAFLVFAMIYLTVGWWLTGRTVGDRVMGVRVVAGQGAPLRLTRALLRAVSCSVFPIGLFWCAVNPRCRSLQDVVLRTSVVYDWHSRVTTRPRP